MVSTTACEWDSIIPLEPMWKEVKRVLKPNGVFVTTASQPFTSMLVMSNLKWFKYEWIWNKGRPQNFFNAKRQPLRNIENVLIFYQLEPVYNPQNVKLSNRIIKNSSSKRGITNNGLAGHNGGRVEDYYIQEYSNYPTQIIDIPAEDDTIHPTQKPVALYEYLVRTYTNPGDTVLDICFGSGTTGVACIQAGRNFIGIELNQEYFDIGQRRIEQTQPPLFVEAPIKLLNTAKQEALAL